MLLFWQWWSYIGDIITLDVCADELCSYVYLDCLWFVFLVCQYWHLCGFLKYLQLTWPFGCFSIDIITHHLSQAIFSLYSTSDAEGMLHNAILLHYLIYTHNCILNTGYLHLNELPLCVFLMWNSLFLCDNRFHNARVTCNV